MVSHIQYSFELARRFINDYKLPIDIVTDKEQFMYELSFFEHSHNSKTLWDKLMYIIATEYDSNPELFLKEYYAVRDNIINDILNKSEYIEFCNSDKVKAKYTGLEYPHPKYKEIYNQETAKSNKTYLSFDLKSANYQVFSICGILNYPTYRDFIADYTKGGMLDYIAGSKYFRQVIFGKLNPGRTIKYEKAVMLDVYNVVKNIISDVECMVFNADEFIIEMPDDESFYKIICAIQAEFSGKLNIRTESFKIEGFEYYTKGSDLKIGEMYRRTCDPEYKFRCVTQAFLKLVHCAYRNQMPNERDYIVKYNQACTARLQEDIIIKTIC